MKTEDVASLWAAAWSNPDPEPFANLYALNGEYFDIPFGVKRRGRELLRQHHQIWWGAVPDFTMTLEKFHCGPGFVTLEAVGRGTFSGSDLGGSRMKATMLPFSGRTCAVLVLNGSNEIVSCTEYYDRSVMPGGAKPPFDA